MDFRRCRIFILSLAVVFAANGFLRPAYAGIPCLHGMNAATADHAHDPARGMHHHGRQDAPSKKAAKCCGLCIPAAAIAVAYFAQSLDLKFSKAFYAAGSCSLHGRWGHIDPGIPKRFS